MEYRGKDLYVPHHYVFWSDFVCHIPTVWHAKNGVITACQGVCVHSPVILSLKECRSIKHTRNSPHHYCAVFLTWLLLYIVVVFHYLNMCFLCVNLRLSVFSVICYHFPYVYAFMHLLSTTKDKYNSCPSC